MSDAGSICAGAYPLELCYLLACVGIDDIYLILLFSVIRKGVGGKLCVAFSRHKEGFIRGASVGGSVCVYPLQLFPSTQLECNHFQF